MLYESVHKTGIADSVDVFELTVLWHHFADIDECAQGSHMCHYNQQCVNTVGTYRCQAKCGPGFKPSAMATSCEGKFSFCYFGRFSFELDL